MVEKKKLLFVTQEMDPYTAITEVSEITKKLPEYAQSNGMEIRVLMPRYGIINERRHRLHEVVRLSGMNIIVDDDDYPLIIKVASLPGARLQVYFLDNDDFFKRKTGFADDNGNLYVAGPFNGIGGVKARNIAKWNGSTPPGAWRARRRRSLRLPPSARCRITYGGSLSKLRSSTSRMNGLCSAACDITAARRRRSTSSRCKYVR